VKRKRKETAPVSEVVEFKSKGVILHSGRNGTGDIHLNLAGTNGWCHIGTCYGSTLNIDQHLVLCCRVGSTYDWSRVPIPEIVIAHLNGLHIKRIRVELVKTTTKSFGLVRHVSYVRAEAQHLRSIARAGKRRIVKGLVGPCVMFRLSDFHKPHKQC
jgi:hypothetical protein